MKSNIVEIAADSVPKPNSSELECRRNTSPEVIYPLILGYLQAMTGLDWKVKVRLTDVDDVNADYTVKCEVIMSLPKEKFDSKPDEHVVPGVFGD